MPQVNHAYSNSTEEDDGAPTPFNNMQNVARGCEEDGSNCNMSTLFTVLSVVATDKRAGPAGQDVNFRTKVSHVINTPRRSITALLHPHSPASPW